MANRDYVRRGKGAPKSNKKKTPPARKPWRSILFAIPLVSAFAYGLYWLSATPAPEKPASTPAANTVKAKAPTQSQTLPELPEEQWEYTKILPEREVEVEAKELKVSDIPYIMQCGAFKRMSDAEERKLNIAFQGISSQIRKKENSSWYRVVLGPYSTKRAAERDRHKLQRAKIEPCAIWKEQQ